MVSILSVSWIPEYLSVAMLLPYEQESVLNAGSTVHIILNVERVAHDIVLLYSHKICSMPIVNCVELPPL